MLRKDLIFHLHGLYYDQQVADAYLFADRHAYLDNQSGYWGFNRYICQPTATFC